MRVQQDFKKNIKMKKKVIIKRKENLNILKALSTLLNNGADISFADIEVFLKTYEEEDKVEVIGSLESIDRSILDFDSYGVDYTIESV
jgi:hypothetical protein